MLVLLNSQEINKSFYVFFLYKRTEKRYIYYNYFSSIFSRKVPRFHAILFGSSPGKEQLYLYR